MLKQLRTAAAVAMLTVASYGVAVEMNASHPDTYVVQKGDTLWDIAAGVAGGGDVRAMVDHIRDLNALDTGMVTAGQRLLVPAE